jgi:ATP-binding cassette, subfamily G (WHITE), member 2, SNQ2
MAHPTPHSIPSLVGPSASATLAFQNREDHDEPNVPIGPLPPSPVIPGRRARRSSSVSRVDIGHFDPIGVDELRRTMSRMSANIEGEDDKEAKKGIFVRSQLTLPVGDGPFDFEKCLREVVKKYVSHNYLMKD